MSAEVTVALIALGGAVLSIIASVLISTRQTSTELQKLRTEIRQTYADKLVEKRLEFYPALYFILSDFIKSILKLGTVSRESISTLRAEIDDWDSKYSFLFGGRTGAICHRFRRLLGELSQQTDEALQERLRVADSFRELRHAIGEFELALKSDLGIFIVEFPEGEKQFGSYGEIENALKQQPTSHTRK